MRKSGLTGPPDPLWDNSQKNNVPVTRHRYLVVIHFKSTGCLLWQPVRNVIAGHSWCKGEGRPLASAADPQSVNRALELGTTHRVAATPVWRVRRLSSWASASRTALRLIRERSFRRRRCLGGAVPRPGFGAPAVPYRVPRWRHVDDRVR